ncbi:MAG: DUF465 domain-containing protein [Shewanella sp.]|nr:DUF465 domain-containing protein [Shewanella sp.]MCF1429568.1 DUF465 domain-containing protein [Shewanella sp.]MCF1437480.1 DUF465 domain-containing protein [Shewanella sp.]MCF1457003.1 DUF465 domain-containing protein [Shewanella sp.]
MLGENHSLTHDFPEFTDLIHQLTQSNEHFAHKSRRYHELDKKIRGLELNGVPTTDSRFVAMKAERVELKDELHGMLTVHSA